MFRRLCETVIPAPTFQKRIAIGDKGYPFNLSERKYQSGLCPVAENLYFEKIIGIECCACDYTEDATTQIISAIKKVHSNVESLKINKDEMVT